MNKYIISILLLLIPNVSWSYQKVIYINGIQNTFDQFQDSVDQLESLLKESNNHSNKIQFDVEGIWNPIGIDGNTQGPDFIVDNKELSQSKFNEKLYSDSYRKLILPHDSFYRNIEEFDEKSADNVLSYLSQEHPSFETPILESFKYLTESDTNLIVVAHSQGNLIANYMWAKAVDEYGKEGAIEKLRIINVANTTLFSPNNLNITHAGDRAINFLDIGFDVAPRTFDSGDGSDALKHGFIETYLSENEISIRDNQDVKISEGANRYRDRLEDFIYTAAESFLIPSISFSDKTLEITEDDSGVKNLNFEVLLIPNGSTINHNVSVDIETQDVTATAGVDYEKLEKQTFTFNSQTNEQSITVSIPIFGDADSEINESFRLVLSNPVGARIYQNEGEATGTILDDDIPIVSVKSNVIIEERSFLISKFMVPVYLEPTSQPEPVTVEFEISSGTATAGDDFTIGQTSLEFPLGSTEENLIIPIINDHEQEPDETFTVKIISVSNAIIGNSEAIVTIVDDEQDNTSPVITLNGDNPMIVTKGDTFTDPGAIATDNVDDNVAVSSSGTVDTSTVDTFIITYTATDSAENYSSLTRTVSVVDAPDTTAPVITLNGDNPMTVTKGETFTDSGATAQDDRDGAVAVTPSGTVDTSTIGAYTITYTATDTAENTASLTRTVNVVDAPDTTAPVITLNGDNPMSVTKGETFTDPGATAQDDKDGTVDITSSGSVDTSVLGTYTITYTAMDSADNSTSKTRTVNVVDAPDTTAPVITLNGDDPISVTKGETFTDPGATALDNKDGNVDVNISGTVDTSIIGTYTLTYTATDSAENNSSKTRTVNVVAPAPVITSVVPDTESVYATVAQNFVVTGLNLTDSIVMQLDDCPLPVLQTGGSATQRIFRCTPLTVGSKSGLITDNEIQKSFTVNVEEKPDSASTGEITSPLAGSTHTTTEIQITVTVEDLDFLKKVSLVFKANGPSYAVCDDETAIVCNGTQVSKTVTLNPADYETVTGPLNIGLWARDYNDQDTNVDSAAITWNPVEYQPQNVIAEAGDSQVRLSWDAVTDVTGYDICYATEVITDAVNCETLQNGVLQINSSSPTLITGLTNTTEYHLVVIPKKADGNGVVSEEVVATPVPNSLLMKCINEHLGLAESVIPTQTQFESIVRLECHSKMIVDISALSRLTNLQYLDLANNQIRGINVLSALTSLQNLFLAKNKINDISALSGLTSLQAMSLGDNQISNISALSEIVSLQILNLRNNQISNISPLSNLTNLQFLILENIQVSDINALSGLTTLQHLFLSDNHISNLSALSSLINLTTLDLSNNQISDISPLSGLTSLPVLFFNSNQVNDISALSGLTGLENLELKDNCISDFSVLPTGINIVVGKNEQRTFCGSWTEVSQSTTKQLNASWGSNSSNVFAVGANGAIVHYNGISWSSMNSTTTNDLYGMWGSSGSDVFAVGYGGTIIHYDGTNWSTMNSGTSFHLRDVWGSSANDVFAVGASGIILHYNGSTWSFVDSVQVAGLEGIWGSSASDVYTVGFNGQIFHYDGISWASVSSGITDWLQSIWGNGPNDIFAVGYGGTILHYDGTSWSKMPNPFSGSSTILSGVWGSSDNDVFVVGNNGTIMHYNGTSWTIMESGTIGWLFGIWGSSANDVFTTGDSGTTLHYE